MAREIDPSLEDIGEKEFLRGLLGRLPIHRTFLNGFGDDAGAVAIPASQKVLLCKIDRAAAPMAARKGWADYRMWGRLAITSNCSDILAGRRHARRDDDRDGAAAHVERAQRGGDCFGCAEECERHDVAFVGGDTKEGSTRSDRLRRRLRHAGAPSGRRVPSLVTRW